VPAAAVVALPSRQGRALEDWLRQRAALEGLEITEEAARLLVEWVGDDAAGLLGEARKAALAGGPEPHAVGVKEVAAVVGERRLSGIFDLTRAVERRQPALALKLLETLLAGEEPMRLLALLTTEVRTAWTVREGLRRGQTVEQMARALRRPPGVVQGYAAAAAASVSERGAGSARGRAGSEARGSDRPPDARGSGTLAWKLRRCWEVERRLKSGGDARAELVALVAELCTR
jgi:DNA polymerase III delta subunit